MKSGMGRMLGWAAAYLALAWLAYQSATPPLMTTVVYPAAGLAVYAILEDGRIGLAGVFLGAVLVGALLFAPQYGSTNVANYGIVVPVLVTFEAFVAAEACRRWLAWPIPRASVHGSLRFVVIATASSLITPLVGRPLFGFLESTTSLATYMSLHVWLSHATGIMLGLPLVALCLAPTRGWRERRAAVGIPLLGLALVIAAASLAVSKRAEEVVRQQFDADSALAIQNLRERLIDVRNVTKSLQLFASQDEVTRAEFQTAAAPWADQSEKIHALGMVVPVRSEAERIRVERIRRAEGERDFRVFRSTPDGGKDYGASDAPRSVVFRVAPPSRSPFALGTDLRSRPAMADALRRALLTGQQSASRGFRLLDPDIQDTAVAFFAPIPSSPSVSDDMPRPEAIYVITFPARLIGEPRNNLEACLFEEAPEGRMLLGGSASCDSQDEAKALYSIDTHEHPGGANWTLAIRADAAYASALHGPVIIAVLVGAWAASALMIILLYEATTRERQVHRQVEQRTAELRALEHRFLDVLESGKLLALQLDLQGRVTFCNAVLCQLSGWRPDELLGREWLRMMRPPETVESGLRDFQSIIETGAPAAYEAEILTRSGERRRISWRMQRLLSADGETVGLAAIGEDITDRRAAEEEIERTRALLSGAISQSPSGIVIADAPSGEAVLVNPAAERLCDLWAADSAPRFADGSVWQLRLPNGRECPREEHPLTLANQGQVTQSREMILRTAAGSSRWISVNAAPIRNSAGQILASIVVFHDISDIKEQQQRLEHLAHYDALTRLPNRVLLSDRLAMAMERAQRLGERLAVAYLDLDGFKEVNDQRGHETGDRLLIEVAAHLNACLRGDDSVARIGGDEFALLLTGLEDDAGWQPVIERILTSLAQPVQIDGIWLGISASIGVTLYPDDDAGPEILLRHADQAMYVAKQNGRNQWHLFDSDHDRQTRQERALYTRIEEALEAGEFVLHYQPKVDLEHGGVSGLEVLIRWQHPEEGLLPPRDFLPALDGTPLAVQVGQWVLETAVAQAMQWKREGLDLQISVNLAPEQLRDPDFPDSLRRLLAQWPGFRPERLELEILETTAFDDIARISSTIMACSMLGVGFAIDDFGTGYSSFTFFRHFPAQTLKIDQSFIRDMLLDVDALAIVKGIIGIARVFRRRVVAEGVETEQHGALLRKLGCDLIQGYGVARPMPAEAVPAWLAQWKDANWVRALPANANAQTVRTP